MFRLLLKDKGNTPFSVDKPDDFLSQKAIERRIRQKLTVDSIDLPVSPEYFEVIKNTGAAIRTYSKWVKTIVVQLTDSCIASKLRELPFVDEAYCVWKGILPKPLALMNHPNETKRKSAHSGISEVTTKEGTTGLTSENDYGSGFDQIRLNNGHLLHNAGFRGKGVSIAVVDEGFMNVDRVSFFDQNRLIAVKSFNHETSDPLRSGLDHGTKVLSCLLSDKPGEMTGTAPEADYYLFRSETNQEEYPVEEDYWIAALEYADSLGIDIMTTSLGYFNFNDASMNHSFSQLDGKTIPMSRAASLSASRGMLLFVAAGNEGNKQWKYITVPGDAANVITVGSIMRDSTLSAFSSTGYTADNRIKPDLVAMGSAVSVVSSDGYIIQSNGTSFATPILAGLGACLWEAFPDLTAFEMIKLLQTSGNRYLQPDSLFGYGIADVFKAYTQLKNETKKPENIKRQTFVYVLNDRLYINTGNTAKYETYIYTGVGIRLLSASNSPESIDISSLPKGFYIAYIKTENKPYIQKFVKK
jgi:subtilisin family serine protease